MRLSELGRDNLILRLYQYLSNHFFFFLSFVNGYSVRPPRKTPIWKQTNGLHHPKGWQNARRRIYQCNISIYIYIYSIVYIVIDLGRNPGDRTAEGFGLNLYHFTSHRQFFLKTLNVFTWMLCLRSVIMTRSLVLSSAAKTASCCANTDRIAMSSFSNCCSSLIHTFLLHVSTMICNKNTQLTRQD